MFTLLVLSCVLAQDPPVDPPAPVDISTLYTISQPKCSFSMGELIPNATYPTTIFKNSNGDLLTAPYYFEAGVYTIQANVTATDFNTTTILINYGPYMKSSPVYTVVQPVCGNSTGSVTLTTPSGLTYINVSLKNTSNIDQTLSDDKVTFANLPSGKYTLSLNSTDCGVQMIRLELVSSSPRLTLTLNASPCVRQSTVAVSLPAGFTDAAPEFKANGQPVVNGSFALDGSPSVLVTYTGNGCKSSETFSQGLLVPVYAIDVHQTNVKTTVINNINNVTTVCTQQYANISLHYDSTVFSDLVVLNSSNLNVEITYNSFIAPYGSTFTLTSAKCSMDTTKNILRQFTVTPPAPVITVAPPPQVSVSLPPTGCLRSAVVSVVNFLDYSSINLNVGLSNGTMIRIDHKNGIFSNVPAASNITLEYIYGETGQCDDPYRVAPLRLPVQLVDITANKLSSKVEETLIANATQCSLGTVSFNLVKLSPELFASNFTYNFVAGQNVLLNFTTIYGCVAQYNWTAPIAVQYDVPLPVVTKNNTCKYSMDSVLEIQGNFSNIANISIDGAIMPLNKLYSGLTVGAHNISFGLVCPSTTYYLTTFSIFSDSDFVLSYTVSKKDDSCNSTDTQAKITINPKPTFDVLLDGTVAYNDTEGGWIVNAAPHNLTFTNAQCNGSLQIKESELIVETITIDAKVINPNETCSGSKDGSVTFKASNDVAIKTIVVNGVDTYTDISTINTLPAGKHTFLISLNDSNCQFTKVITIGSYTDVPFTFATTSPSGCGVNTDGVVIVSATNPDLIKDFKVTSDVGTVLNQTIYKLAGNTNFTVFIGYKDVCKYNRTLSLTLSNDSIPTPTFTLNAADCGFTNGKFQLNNTKDYTNVYLTNLDRSSIVAVGTDGQFTGLSFNTTYYLTATHVSTGCQFNNMSVTTPDFVVQLANNIITPTNELCQAGYTGRLNISSNSTDSSSVKSFYRLFKDSDQMVVVDTSLDGLFDDMVSGSYVYQQTLIANPFCTTKASSIIDVSFDNNPLVDVDAFGTCSNDSGSGSVSATVGGLPTGNYATIVLNGTLLERSLNTTNGTATLLSVPPADYILRTWVNIPTCRRYFETPVTVENTMGDLQLFVNKTTCDSIIVSSIGGGLLSDNTTVYNFTLTDTTNKTALPVTFGTSTGESKTFPLVRRHNYTLTVTSNGRCSITYYNVSSTPCVDPTHPPVPPRDTGLSTGQLAGIIVGVTLGVSVIGIIAYIVISKKMSVQYHHPVEMDSPQYKLMMDEQQS
ncbi:hypothetical protein SAMD00019534_119990 [Acytostelium subglobosum LB1]|uniref:hypothetical protein n=1 Tax=Acytostelium subglobosum LB1 TaxID=1410327 RepID=UPI0006449C61|nr:hypothetical protein SAMD00019534_119990 [Acytostelium subglobosum LB1]GAM28823.1 hypothetical protein SAMD00019534_119990 [Acytostelium subglobosum LB1]|eukprot:XP_012748195.1 hypothetical protein SAMD00019534_119990 [Acytostelium subglobosum LB1]